MFSWLYPIFPGLPKSLHRWKMSSCHEKISVLLRNFLNGQSRAIKVLFHSTSKNVRVSLGSLIEKLRNFRIWTKYFSIRCVHSTSTQFRVSLKWCELSKFWSVVHNNTLWCLHHLLVEKWWWWFAVGDEKTSYHSTIFTKNQEPLKCINFDNLPPKMPKITALNRSLAW